MDPKNILDLDGPSQGRICASMRVAPSPVEPVRLQFFEPVELVTAGFSYTKFSICVTPSRIGQRSAAISIRKILNSAVISSRISVPSLSWIAW